MLLKEAIDKKYKIRHELWAIVGTKFRFKVEALIDIPMHGVKIGDLGGYIECEHNLDISTSSNAWVAGNAVVSENARVFENALVSGDARVSGDAQVSENAHIGENALVYENAVVSDDTEVLGYAEVFGSAQVFGNAYVTGDARVLGNAQVCGDAQVCGHGQVYGNTQVFGAAQVFGDAEVSGDARVYGAARVFGNASLSGHAHIVDIDIDAPGLYAIVSGFDENITVTYANIYIGFKVLTLDTLDTLGTYFYCSNRQIRNTKTLCEAALEQILNNVAKLE